jgi:aminopeptidase N
VFRDMLRQFRRWSLSESEMGPVFLGHRLGRLSGGPRVFRALVYNKGAAVLHMLRRLVGDDVFFRGLREFYQAHQFESAGTDDLQRIFETAAGRPLGRFFDRWILGSEIPRVRDRSRIVDGRLTIHLEQLNETVFDLPVTATVAYEDGESVEMGVVMDDRVLERPLDAGRRVRSVRFNRDFGALAEFVD